MSRSRSRSRSCSKKAAPAPPKNSGSGRLRQPCKNYKKTPSTTCRPFVIHICSRSSVAEPPLFWAAPAPDVRGPGGDSGSRQKRVAPGGSSSSSGSCSFYFSFQLWKIQLLLKIIFGSYCFYKLNLLHFYMFQSQGSYYFSFLKDPTGAGAAIKQRLRLTAPAYQKIGSGPGAASKVAPAPQHWVEVPHFLTLYSWPPLGECGVQRCHL